MNRSADIQRVKSSLGAQVRDSHLIPTLIRLLSAGEPVSVEQLSSRSGLTLAEVSDELAEHPSLERDPEGAIVGFGMTLRPTQHKFSFRGRTLYGWCATDTLMFPILLNEPGLVESVCSVTGGVIRLSVTPDGVESVDPTGTVVSEVRPTERVDDIRGDICSVGLFFSSREAAAPWLEHYPQGQLHTVEYDFEIHRQAIKDLGWLSDAELTPEKGAESS